jgi:hypothetical protein
VIASASPVSHVSAPVFFTQPVPIAQATLKSLVSLGALTPYYDHLTHPLAKNQVSKGGYWLFKGFSNSYPVVMGSV